MATILLTGGTGFLGRNLLSRLRSEGHGVVLLKRSTSDLGRLGMPLEAITAYDADTAPLQRAFEEHRIDLIVHCATNYGRNNAPPTEVIEANLTLPLSLLQLAARSGVRGFVNSDTLLDKGVNHYTLSKKQFLDWVPYFTDGLACSTVALEHFYGPRDDPSKFVSRILGDLIRGVEQIDLTPGEQRRDFIHVEDVVEAYARIIAFTLSKGSGLYRFEVGTGLTRTIREFVELAKRLTGNTTTRLCFGALPYRANETMDSRVDTSALERLGWSPRVPLEVGLARTIAEERMGMPTVVRYLITGGCGFVGTNMAEALLRAGEDVCLLDNLSRRGSERNLEWLRRAGAFRFEREDVRRFDRVEAIVADVRPDVVLHLAGQVAMTTSLADPRLDFEVNVLGGHNVLEAVRRRAKDAIVIYSSTNKVYGELESLTYAEEPTRWRAVGYERGFDESLALDFRSPYGCSKGAVDQYALDYARMFGLRTVVFRHSTIYGGRQFATVDQGWIGWFVAKAVETAQGTMREALRISGDGKQVRDVLHAEDLVACYLAAIRSIDRARGQVFNLGGGMENSLSLLELFGALGDELGVTLRHESQPWRASDQKVFVADIGKARRLLDWAPRVGKREGLRRMIAWTREQHV